VPLSSIGRTRTSARRPARHVCHELYEDISCKFDTRHVRDVSDKSCVGLTAISFAECDHKSSAIRLSERIVIPLLSQLIPEGIRPGAVLAVEYDAESQWIAVITTIAAKLLKAQGRVAYMVFTRRPEDLKRDLEMLGVNLSLVFKEERLVLYDWYTATLTGGRIGSAGAQASIFEQIGDGLRLRSIKAADLSVQWLKDTKYGPQPEDLAETWPPGALAVSEATSALLRFNEEKDLLEWIETRVIPIEQRAGRVALWGFVRGIHTESFYKRLESLCGGVIDLRVMERGEELKNLFRVRSLKGQPHDTRWHEIEIRFNGEAIMHTKQVHE